MSVLSRRGGLLVLLVAAVIAAAVALVWSLVGMPPAVAPGEQMIAVSPAAWSSWPSWSRGCRRSTELWRTTR